MTRNMSLLFDTFGAIAASAKAVSLTQISTGPCGYQRDETSIYRHKSAGEDDDRDEDCLLFSSMCR